MEVRDPDTDLLVKEKDEKGKKIKYVWCGDPFVMYRAQ